VDPLDVPSRLDELRLLKDGWLDGRLGKAPDSTGLDLLRAAFEGHYAKDLILPYLYPTAEGGIQAEWTLGKAGITLDIELPSQRAVWHSLDLESHEEHSQDLDLSSVEGWHWVNQQIRLSSRAQGQTSENRS